MATGAQPEQVPTDGPRRTDRGRQRAEQLLDAGAAALAARPAQEVLPSRAETLRATRDGAGALGPASAGSFRNLFGSLSAYHRRLVEERLIVNPAVPDTAALLAEVAEAIAADRPVNVADRLARIARLNLQANLDRPDAEQARMVCFAAALAPGGEFAADALREDFQGFTGELAAVYAQILEAWGMKLREPFDVDALAVLLGALAHGLTLRHLIDPEAVDLEAYQHALVALLLLLVARPSDDRGIAQLIQDTFPPPGRPAK